MNTYRSS
jgi:hypothetical protein